ncbi:MAG: UvrD-helicase domain-containing protein [Candidatus Omnitrophica bacterium]|nr:UvrD-helicase domain-containing protein [Candidatus Omnitrophota bacterium]
MSKPNLNFQFPEVRVVEASAGSGKTYALAKRYVQLLLLPKNSSIREILALTFTNKAAFEMKRRILYFLRSMALGVMPAEELNLMIAPVGISPEAARLRCADIMDDIIRNYDFFQVETIDTFINSMLSGCAFKLGVSANFKIKTQARDYLELSLDQLIDSAFVHSPTMDLLKDFLHSYLYIENRSGWFPKKDMLAIINDLFKEINSRQGQFVTSPLKSEALGELRGIILDEMKLLKQALPSGIDKRFVVKLDKFLTDHKKGFDIDSVPDWFTHEDIPVKKGSDVSDDADMLWNLIRQNLLQMCVDEATSLFNPYVHIFNAAWSRINDLARQEDLLFLSELNRRASQMIKDGNITIEELAFRLTSRYRHYLLDEFQDTSRLQWSNVHGLVHDTLAQGGSLFYVGDKKQAIYRFRGGDVTLFDDVKEDFKPFNVQEEQLSRNWRSRQNIIEFNNRIFSMANLNAFIDRKQKFEKEQPNKKNPVILSDKDRHFLEKVFGGSAQDIKADRTGGYVRFEHIEGKGKLEREDVLKEQFFKVIEDVRQRFELEDIAVLTRTNGQAKLITDWLLEAEIPVQSDVTLDVTQNIVIRDLVAFLKFLNSPVDNLSFCAFILSGVFLKASGLSFDTVQEFLSSLRDKLGRKSEVVIYTEFRKAFPEAWAGLIDEFFKNVGLYPVYELVVTIYRKYDLLNRFPEVQGFLMHFLELIKKQEEEYCDLGMFLEYFEEVAGEDVYVHISSGNAVKVLTVHKSKGLEFPVVILPFLSMDVQVGAGSADNKLSYVVQEAGDALQLLRLKSKYYGYSDDLYNIYAQEYKKEFLSELNSIYVALTRASEEMYGFIPAKVGNSHNLAKFLFADDGLELGTVTGQKIITKKKAEEVVMLESLPAQDWIAYLTDEFVAIEEIKNRKERGRGKLIHAVLARISDLGQQNFDELVSVKEIDAEEQDWNEAVNVVRGLIEAGNFSKFVKLAPGETVLNEQEIVDHYGHSKRIDRMVVRKDFVDVIDYKSGEEYAEEQQEQVRHYMTLIKTMYPQKKVRGYLVYVEKKEIVDVL